mmetsp:Transcript_57515/g.168428  ORF Transcript_57515/g.168428 Transcript_57515/m.168428 type:complete len:264 (+) Transcript_57515:136-927(+)
MAHIPKRATQHGLYISGEDTIPVNLKPGQQELWRRGIYSQDNHGPAESYLSQELQAKSEYSRTILSSTLPEHYLEPRKPHRRPVFETSGGMTAGGADGWRSEYRGQLCEESLAGRTAYRRQRGAHHEPVRALSCVGRPEGLSAYQHDFGRYGSDPRDRIRPGEKRLPVLKSDLHAGTTKGSDLTPGYQGHIPACSSAPASARGLPSGTPRSVDKTNIAHIFHTNLVGYAGHVPESHRNDQGGRKATDLTTTGKDFVAHWGGGA